MNIVQFILPAKRRRFCEVNARMKNVIDESMRDVEEIILSQTEPSTTDCRLEMKTAHPYAYAPKTVQEMFKILNIKGAFLQLLHLHLASCRVVFDNCVTLGALLVYLRERSRSVRSLSLLPSPKCCCAIKMRDCTTEDNCSIYVSGSQPTPRQARTCAIRRRCAL
uniref:Uncharacterized protein n=1 Tax=Plectus sambesii TaxID=2011161 RepID=A0A914WWQ4_9BILA